MIEPAVSTNAIQSVNRPLARISLKWNMIDEPNLSILQKFQMIKDLGFDGIELDAPDTLPLDEVLDARDRTGLAIPGVVNSMHWKFPLTDPDPAIRQQCVEATIAALDAARNYGAETMLLVPGAVTAATSYSQAYARAVVEMPRILDHADSVGVVVAFENVWNNFLLSPLEAATFVDGFKHSRAGWYLDVGNVLRYGKPTDWIEALGTRIRRVDIKEYSLSRMNAEGPWKGFEVELGDGDCDWPAVNRALSAVGYSGWGSVEVPGGNRDRLAAIKERVDRNVRM